LIVDRIASIPDRAQVSPRAFLGPVCELSVDCEYLALSEPIVILAGYSALLLDNSLLISLGSMRLT
jgi:hypothetical protein